MEDAALEDAALAAESPTGRLERCDERRTRKLCCFGGGLGRCICKFLSVPSSFRIARASALSSSSASLDDATPEDERFVDMRLENGGGFLSEAAPFGVGALSLAAAASPLAVTASPLAVVTSPLVVTEVVACEVVASARESSTAARRVPTFFRCWAMFF